MLRQILGKVAEAVIERTSYRRVIVSLYTNPVSPSSNSETRVVDYAAKGLTAEEEQEILDFITAGKSICKEKFHPSFQLGSAYYIPKNKIPHSLVPYLPSHRHFINTQGWHADDLLLIPLRIDEGIIGQISVDDPLDSACLKQETLDELEKLASIAAIALNLAYHQEQLNAKSEFLHLLANSTVSGSVIVQDRRFRYISSQALDLLGYSREKLLAINPWWEVIHPEERGIVMKSEDRPLPLKFNARGIRSNGSAIWLELRSQEIDYQGRPALLIRFLDISDRVQTEANLREKMLRDPLTGLFNRLYFDEAIERELKRSQRYNHSFTIMMTDLAGFKRVNDQLGHQAGDRVLHDIAQVIQQQLRESDWLVRYGGDEFLIVLPETDTEQDELAQRLRATIEQWSIAHLTELSLKIDVGWATWHAESNIPITRLVQLADIKMYEAKRRHKNPPTHTQPPTYPPFTSSKDRS